MYFHGVGFILFLRLLTPVAFKTNDCFAMDILMVFVIGLAYVGFYRWVVLFLLQLQTWSWILLAFDGTMLLLGAILYFGTMFSSLPVFAGGTFCVWVLDL